MNIFDTVEARGAKKMINRAAYQELKNLMVEYDGFHENFQRIESRAKELTGNPSGELSIKFFYNYGVKERTYGKDDERLEARARNFIAAVGVTLEPSAEEKIEAAKTALREALAIGGLSDGLFLTVRNTLADLARPIPGPDSESEEDPA